MKNIVKTNKYIGNEIFNLKTNLVLLLLLQLVVISQQ